LEILLRKLTIVASLAFTLLSGCATYETHQARATDGTKLIGSNVLDLVQSVGIPDKMMKTVNTGGTADRMTVQWTFANSDSALDLNVILIELKVGGAGKCTMTADVNRWGGKVLAINFPQAHTDSFGSSYAACSPLVGEALSHMPHTPIDPTYDAFNLVGAAK